MPTARPPPRAPDSPPPPHSRLRPHPTPRAAGSRSAAPAPLAAPASTPLVIPNQPSALAAAPADSQAPTAHKHHRLSICPAAPPSAPATAPCTHPPPRPRLHLAGSGNGPTGSRAGSTPHNSSARRRKPTPLPAAAPSPVLQTFRAMAAMVHSRAASRSSPSAFAAVPLGPAAATPTSAAQGYSQCLATTLQNVAIVVRFELAQTGPC